VEQKVWEVNTAFFEAYQRIYDIIKLPDGSMCYIKRGDVDPETSSCREYQVNRDRMRK